MIRLDNGEYINPNEVEAIMYGEVAYGIEIQIGFKSGMISRILEYFPSNNKPKGIKKREHEKNESSRYKVWKMRTVKTYHDTIFRIKAND